MLLSDNEIDKVVQEQGMIDPYVGQQVSHVGGRKVVSYGLSSAGYDLRVSDEFKVFSPMHNHEPVDVKAFNHASLTLLRGETCVVPAHSYVLCRSVERFRMPRDVVATCLGKSTYARVGLIVNVTPLEPGWEGYLTLEVSNSSPCPVRIYANEGMAQLQFHRLVRPPAITYADRSGKYQGQEGIVPPRMKDGEP